MSQKTYSIGSLYAADPESLMVMYLLQEGYCNAKCKHCYMHLQKQNPKSRDVKVARKDLESLVSQGYKVHLRGTEILLNQEYLSLFPLVEQKYIQTNGKILHDTPKLFEELKKVGISKIMLTYPTEPKDLMDFSKEMVDRVIQSGSKNSFRMVTDFVVTRNIIDLIRGDNNYFNRLCEQLMNVGASELRFVRLIPFSKELKEITPSAKETEEVVRESVKLESLYKGRLDVTRAGQFGFYDLRRELKERYFGIKVPEPEESGIMDCPAGKKLFVIDLNNHIYPCLYLMGQNHRIGKLEDGRIILKERLTPAKLHSKDCPAYVENYNKYFSEKNVPTK
ncbi:MAG TPA: hypothetical protein VJ438_02935 [Candidatus Nanoarchaeia archaeon]|nr:hypothetical protein [Candidatus Nanoarchaeia archaeon]